MQLEHNETYNFSSSFRTIQLTVPNGETAQVSIKLAKASQPIVSSYTESQLLSGYIGHAIVSVSGANCEFTVSPENGVDKI